MAKSRTKGALFNPEYEGDQQHLKTLMPHDLNQKLYTSHKKLAVIHLIESTDEEEAVVAGIRVSYSVVVRY